MKTKRLNWLLMATLMVGLGTTITACSDDDNDKNKSQQPAELADPLDTDEARVAWRWLNQLTSTETLTTDWASKTYEPTVGIASENNALTRIVVCTDLEDARQHFASLADIEEDKLGSEQTVSQGGVGKMTWTPSKAGAQNLAEVTVDTKLIPKLQKIVFCTSEQTGLNGIFSDNVKGTAYYRLGDVVREEATGYYWVCVRPAFEQGDKGDSHWIHLFNASPTGNKNGQKVPFPEANIYSKYNNVNKYKSQTILLPTKLKYDRKHIYNLSNLVWAMINPNLYHTTVGDKGKGLCGFDYQYHGEKFLANVNNFWDKDYENDNITVWQKVFGRSRDQMEEFKNTWFFYQGYKWWSGDEATLWVYKSKGYESKVPGSESGDKEDYDMVEDGFDVKYLAGDPDADDGKPFDRFQNNNGVWVVEYKTGKELSQTGAYSPIGPIPGTTEIYRYNAYTKTACGSALETETSVKSESFEQDEPQVGYVLGQNGKYYKTREKADAATKAIALVVYISPKKSNGVRDAVETGSTYHVIAMGLKDVDADCWADEKLEEYCFTQTADIYFDKVSILLDGLHNTQQLKRGCDVKHHTHPVIQCLNEYTKQFGHNLKDVSEWFIPSAGQLKLAFESMGTKLVKDFHYIFQPTIGDDTALDTVKRFLGDKADNFVPEKNGRSTFYWTAAESNQYYEWTMDVNNDGTIYFNSTKKGTTNGSVRPFLLIGTEGEYIDEDE